MAWSLNVCQNGDLCFVSSTDILYGKPFFVLRNSIVWAPCKVEVSWDRYQLHLNSLENCNCRLPIPNFMKIRWIFSRKEATSPLCVHLINLVQRTYHSINIFNKMCNAFEIASLCVRLAWDRNAFRWLAAFLVQTTDQLWRQALAIRYLPHWSSSLFQQDDVIRLHPSCERLGTYLFFGLEFFSGSLFPGFL